MQDDIEKKYIPIIIQLQESRELDGVMKTFITMRPPNANDAIIAQTTTANNVEADRLLFANLTDTTEDFIGSLSLYDYKMVEKANDCFLLPIPIHLGRCASLYPEQPVVSP